jgi:hypothetical protein
MAAPATSAPIERLFSVSRRVCTFDHVRLKPASVDTLTTLHVWETFVFEKIKEVEKA